jgi:hypothetical protein
VYVLSMTSKPSLAGATGSGVPMAGRLGMESILAFSLFFRHYKILRSRTRRDTNRWFFFIPKRSEGALQSYAFSLSRSEARDPYSFTNSSRLRNSCGTAALGCVIGFSIPSAAFFFIRGSLQSYAFSLFRIFFLYPERSESP